jgi:hypothetical protein
MRFEFSEVPRLVLPAIFALLLALGSCGDSLLDVEFKNDPMGNFDALWSEFDRYYALFDVRLVNWDSLYAVYRPTVHKGLDDRELFLAMKGLLAPLRDRHVSLSIPDGLFFNSGSVDGKALFPDSHPSMNNIDRRMLIRKSLGTYLDSVFVSSTEYGLPGDFSWYGTIAPTHTDSKLGTWAPSQTPFATTTV